MGNSARADFELALDSYLLMSGLLTDELQANDKDLDVSSSVAFADARVLPENAGLPTGSTYGLLQSTRAMTNQAIGALSKYDPDSSVANRGELYAIEGYAELMLADLFCSGVPLSTMDFEADFTYRAGSTTDQVYTHAIALFDTALVLAGNDTAVGPLARVGKARALLAQGQYAAAATAVEGVPVSFAYAHILATCPGGSGCGTYSTTLITPVLDFAYSASVSDSEGVTGLPYRSAADPRLPLTKQAVAWAGSTYTVWVPTRYAGTTSRVVIASGVEAQLIAAEAALQANGASGDWLTLLNALRTDGTQTGATYNAGTGGVAGLPPLSDPGSDTARVSLVFRERAFWLFLSGQRQGDLRRLVRKYHRPQETVYPRGTYGTLSAFSTSTVYGTAVDAPIDPSELANPLFHGCLSRD
jgi:hypothetical protein